jgi:hypothetical protein
MRVSRRELLLAGLALPLVGCGENPKPTAVPKNIKPADKLANEAEIEEQLGIENIQRVSKFVIENFNKVYETTLSPQEFASSIVLVNTEKEMRDLFAKYQSDYKPNSDPISVFAFTSLKDDPLPNRVFVYKGLIASLTKGATRVQREEFLEWLLSHEAAHWSNAHYESNELHKTLWGTMVANLPELKGKNVKQGYVDGASIIAYVDGKRVKGLIDCEEAEADIIGNNAMAKRGKPKTINYLPTHDEVKTEMMTNLLKSLDLNYEETIKQLVKARTTPNGMEKFYKRVADRYGVVGDRQLIFALTLMYAIQVKSPEIYSQAIKIAEAERKLSPTPRN